MQASGRLTDLVTVRSLVSFIARTSVAAWLVSANAIHTGIGKAFVDL